MGDQSPVWKSFEWKRALDFPRYKKRHRPKKTAKQRLSAAAHSNKKLVCNHDEIIQYAKKIGDSIVDFPYDIELIIANYSVELHGTFQQMYILHLIETNDDFDEKWKDCKLNPSCSVLMPSNKQEFVRVSPSVGEGLYQWTFTLSAPSHSKFSDDSILSAIPGIAEFTEESGLGCVYLVDGTYVQEFKSFGRQNRRNVQREPPDRFVYSNVPYMDYAYYIEFVWQRGLLSNTEFSEWWILEVIPEESIVLKQENKERADPKAKYSRDHFIGRRPGSVWKFCAVDSCTMQCTVVDGDFTFGPFQWSVPNLNRYVPIVWNDFHECLVSIE
jgi:hypothetical protein